MDQPKFHSRKNLLTFAQWHILHGEGVLSGKGLNQLIFMEKSLRTSMKEGIMIDYHIEPIEGDFNGIGKYMNAKSYAIISYEGKQESWPLTMLYLNK